MAKVNKQFVLIALVGAFAALSIIGLTLFFQRKGDTTRHMAAGAEHRARAASHSDAGDIAAEQEELGKALQRFGVALDKQKGNREYYDKYVETLKAMVPQTEQDSRERYRMWLSTRSHEALYWPRDPETHKRRIRELYQRARIIPKPEHWVELGEAGESMWSDLDEDEPQRLIGRLYMGIAAVSQVRVTSQSSVTDDDTGEAILDEVLDVDPQNDIALAAKMGIRFARARAFEFDGKDREAAQALAELDAMLEEHAGDSPTGPRVAMIKVRRMVMLQQNGEAAYTDAEYESLADDIERMSLDALSDDSMILLEATAAITVIPIDGAGDRAAAILREYVDAHPTAVAHIYWLARQYLHNGEYDLSRETAQRIIDMEPLPVGLESAILWSMREQAASIVVEGQQYRWQTVPEDERDAVITEIVAARDQLSELLQGDEDDILLLRANARLLFAQRQYRASNEKFNKLIRLTGGSSAEDLFQSAIVLSALRESGAALKRIEDALEREPRDLRYLVQKARIQSTLRHFNSAGITIQQVLNVDPDNEDAKEVRQQILAARAVDEDDPVADAIRTAGRAAAEDDFQTALAMLKEQEVDHPEDFRLILELMRVNHFAGNAEDAKTYHRAAKQINPNNSTVKRWDILLTYDDPVERQRQLIDRLDGVNEAGKLVRTVVGMESLVRRNQAAAKKMDAAGDTEGADVARDIVARATLELDAARKRLEAVEPEHPDYIAFQYDLACLNEDWDEAQRLVDIAARINADHSDGLLYQGDLHVKRGRFSEAVATLKDAIKRFDDSIAWLRLGEAYEGMGDYEKAMAAFKTSYGKKPDDPRTVKKYADLLIRMGRHNEASNTLRLAVKQMPSNRELHSRWLVLESQVGDLWTVLNERMKVRADDPGDFENALRLAGILTTRTPTWRTISKRDGSPKYSRTDWSLLSSQEQYQEVDRAKKLWATLAREIIDDLVEEGGHRLDVRSLQAYFHMQQDQEAEGERILRGFVDQQEEPVDKLNATLKLCEYLGVAKRSAEAVTLLEAVRSLQSPERLEIDEALATMYRIMDQPEKAIEQYDKVIAGGDRPDLEANVIQLLLQLRRTDEARTRLNAHRQRHGESYRSAMLEEFIFRTEADDLLGQGRGNLALGKYAAQRGSLAKAASENPGSATPHVETAKSFMRSYQISDDVEWLQQALASLDEADLRNASNAGAAIYRADIHRELGNDDAAIAALRDRLNLLPMNTRLRGRLIDLYIGKDNITVALDLTREGIALDPMASQWHDALGDLYIRRDNFAAAAAEFFQALQINQRAATVDSRVLAKYCESLMNVTPPGYTKVIDALSSNADALSADPLLRGLYAQALSSVGRKDDALDEMKLAYAQHAAEIADDASKAPSIGPWFLRLNALYTAAEIENGELEQFFDDVRQAVRQAEPTMWELQAIARSYMSVGERGYERAVDRQTRAVALCPDDPSDAKIEATRFLGYYRMQQGDGMSGALEAFQQILRIDPNHAEANNNVAYILAEEFKKPQDALPFAQKSVELTPDDPNALDTLGWIHYRLANYREAEQELLESYRRHQTATVAYHLGEVYRAMKDARNARKYLGDALEQAKAASNAKLQTDIQRALDDISR